MPAEPVDLIALRNAAVTNPYLDHIIWAHNDLESATKAFESLTGIRPRYGGMHASGLTHNALVGLGGRCYLEILAPVDPTGTQDDEWTRFARTATGPRLFTYCMRSPLPLRELEPLAASLGCRGGKVAGNGRTTPEGVQLHWEWLAPAFDALGRALPFFIDWLDSSHPAESFAKAEPNAAISLTHFAVGHPAAATLRQVLTPLTAPIEIYAAPDLEFQLQLETPRGAVTL
jgi:Glyoxalase-like domain